MTYMCPEAPAFLPTRMFAWAHIVMVFVAPKPADVHVPRHGCMMCLTREIHSPSRSDRATKKSCSNFEQRGETKGGKFCQRPVLSRWKSKGAVGARAVKLSQRPHRSDWRGLLQDRRADEVGAFLLRCLRGGASCLRCHPKSTKRGGHATNF